MGFIKFLTYLIQIASYSIRLVSFVLCCVALSQGLGGTSGIYFWSSGLAFIVIELFLRYVSLFRFEGDEVHFEYIGKSDLRRILLGDEYSIEKTDNFEQRVVGGIALLLSWCLLAWEIAIICFYFILYFGGNLSFLGVESSVSNNIESIIVSSSLSFIHIF